MTTIPMQAAAPVAASAYHPDSLLVTLKPNAVATVASEAMAAAAASAIDAASFRALRGFNGDLLAADPVADILVRPSRLSVFERMGLIAEATPVRRARQSEDMLSSQLPLGTGRAASAAAEAFAGAGDRPSDALLAGTIVVRARSAAELEDVRTGLLGDEEQVASVERIPIRRLQQIVTAEARQPIAPWHLNRIRLDAARRRAGFDDASGVRVAVLDTGIDAEHPLLKPAIDSYSYQSPVPGVSSGSRDLIAHGTHVAGTIAAQGVAGDIEGVCRARLHIYKIFDDDIDGTQVYQLIDGALVVIEENFVNPIMYLRALASCVDNNIDVVNLSIGGPAIGDSREQALFRRLADQNQIVVAAMGNERRNNSPTSWPAAYPSVIAVGALDVNDGVAPFSNGGPHIAVTAPGVDILATMPTYRGVEQWTGRRDASGTVVRDKPIHWTVYRSTMRGTSMASPQVAGAAALFVAAHGRDPAAFRAALERSSRRLSLMGGVVPHPDYGYGCLDIEALF